MSLRTKILVLVVLTALMVSAVTVWRTWWLIRHQTARLSAVQADLALEFDKAIRHYVGRTLRPVVGTMVPDDRFVPEAMSTSLVARSVFDEVRREFPDYVLKFSSENPRNPINAARPEELEVLRHFREHPDEKKWVGTIHLGGREYLVHCIPRRMEVDCLRCHGRVEDAPAELIERYGDRVNVYSIGDFSMEVCGGPHVEHRRPAGRFYVQLS